MIPITQLNLVSQKFTPELSNGLEATECKLLNYTQGKVSPSLTSCNGIFPGSICLKTVTTYFK